MVKYNEIRKDDIKNFWEFQLNLPLIERSCPSCLSNKNTFVFKKDRFTFVKCIQCDCMFVNPLPSDHALKYYYQESKSMEFFHNNILNASKEIREGIMKKRVQSVVEYIKKGSSILEIGSSMGRFLKAAKDQGFEIDGVEPNQALAEMTSKDLKVKVYQDLFQNLKLEKKYEAIVFWEVIEHISNPDVFLDKAKDALIEEGYVFMTLPNMSGIEYEVIGQEHENIEAPGHINYFSPEQIRSLLTRKGFEVVKITTPGIFDFLAIIDYSEIVVADVKKKKDILFLLNKVYNLANHDEKLLLNCLFTQAIQNEMMSGNMFVVARKLI